MITYKLKINCQEPRLLVSDMEFVAGDVGAYRLEMTFLNNGAIMDLTGKQITVKAKRADGTVLSDSGTITGSMAIFVPQNSLFAVPGELMLEIALCDSTQKYMTTKIISATVLESVGEPVDAAENHVSAFVSLLAAAAAKVNQAEALIGDIDTALDNILAIQNTLMDGEIV